MTSFVVCCCLHTEISIYLVNINGASEMGGKERKKWVWNTHRVLYFSNDPPNKRILANSTAFRNGTSTNSCKCSSTENLYFFFFIINAIPGAPGPINVIHNELRSSANTKKWIRSVWGSWLARTLLSVCVACDARHRSTCVIHVGRVGVLNDCLSAALITCLLLR